MIFTFWTAPMSVSEPEARRRQAYACRDALKKKSLHKKMQGNIFGKSKLCSFLFFVFVFKFFHEHRREDAEHTQENQNPADRR